MSAAMAEVPTVRRKRLIAEGRNMIEVWERDI
jgi:hypothetical protein